jgi:hypothetical protein
MGGMRAVVVMSCVLTLLVGAVGCTKSNPPAPAFVIGSEKDARALVDTFLQGYVRLDVNATLERLCERDPDSQGTAAAFIARSQAPGSPFRVDSYVVSAVEPAWVGSEPYFFVDVRFPRPSGSVTPHRLFVRAREGCIERFLGGEPGTQRPQQDAAANDAPAPSAQPGAPEEHVEGAIDL